MTHIYYLLDKTLFNLEPHRGKKHSKTYDGKGAPEFTHNMKGEVVDPYFYAEGYKRHSNDSIYLECFLQAIRITDKKIRPVEDPAIAKHICEITFTDKESIVFGVNSEDSISQWEALTPDSFQVYSIGEVSGSESL